MDIRCYGSRHKDVCKGNVPPSCSCISKQCPFCCALHLSVGYPALVAIQHVLQIMKSFLADLESVRLEFLVAKVTIQISPLTLMLTALRQQVGRYWYIAITQYRGIYSSLHPRSVVMGLE